MVLLRILDIESVECPRDVTGSWGQSSIANAIEIITLLPLSAIRIAPTMKLAL